MYLPCPWWDTATPCNASLQNYGPEQSLSVGSMHCALFTCLSWKKSLCSHNTLWSVIYVFQFYEEGVRIDDLVPSARSSRHLHQYDGEPCPSFANPCSSGGVCSPNLNDFECLCLEGFLGRTCDIGETNVKTADSRSELFRVQDPSDAFEKYKNKHQKEPCHHLLRRCLYSKHWWPSVIWWLHPAQVPK